MSMVTQALVIITSFLLEDKTWAAKQINRQPINPLAEILQGADTQRPFISVYAESADFDIEGRATSGREADIDLKIYVHIAPGVTVTTDPLTDEDVFELTLDATTAALTMDIMVRMVDHAFHIPGIWFDIYNIFVMEVKSRRVRYVLFETEHGVRVPTVEISYKLRTIPDPPHGGSLEKLRGWSKLDAALRTRSDEAIAVADLFKLLIEAENGLPDYQLLQANFGLTAGGLYTTGIGPVADGATDNDGNTPGLGSIDLDTEVEIQVPGGD